MLKCPRYLDKAFPTYEALQPSLADNRTEGQIQWTSCCLDHHQSRVELLMMEACVWQETRALLQIDNFWILAGWVEQKNGRKQKLLTVDGLIKSNQVEWGRGHRHMILGLGHRGITSPIQERQIQALLIRPWTSDPVNYQAVLAEHIQASPADPGLVDPGVTS